MAVITLTTDFGTQDEYVGVLRGVICGIAPQATVVDITHHIAPHDVTGAAFMLKSAFAWFPNGTIHVAVVDPGVGGPRSILAGRSAGHLFIAPDNGLLTLLLDAHGADELIAVQTQTYIKKPLSRTFHGRDIFAPVAAHLALGVPLEAFGKPVDRTGLIRLAQPQSHTDAAGRVHGHVVWVDRFGNLITDIHQQQLKALALADGGRELRIDAGGRIIHGLVQGYYQRPAGEAAAIIGSRDCLEIAVNQDSAERVLAIGRGAPICVYLADRTGGSA